MNNQQKKHNTQEKIQSQITRIEQIIDKLLENINIEELSTYERLTIAHRLFAQQQRAIKIQQTAMIEGQPQAHEVTIVTLMSLMRGEKIKRDQIIDMQEDADGKNH